jgi:hypothetical protein
MHENLLKFKKSQKYGFDTNPLVNFLFALMAPETKRQYPKRLEVFLDFLNLSGTFEDNVLDFYQKAIANPSWLSQKLKSLSRMGLDSQVLPPMVMENFLTIIR